MSSCELLGAFLHLTDTYTMRVVSIFPPINLSSNSHRKKVCSLDRMWEERGIIGPSTPVWPFSCHVACITLLKAQSQSFFLGKCADTYKEFSVALIVLTARTGTNKPTQTPQINKENKVRQGYKACVNRSKEVKLFLYAALWSSLSDTFSYLCFSRNSQTACPLEGFDGSVFCV